MVHFNDFNNPQVALLPNHLKQFIVEQHYAHYTPVDHAVWRYVMRQNYSFLKDIAYYPYIPGLEAAGLSIEKIPDLQEMNDALAKIGWGAVTVDGFIPPAAFMEYQAYKVLVIAADIRQLKHIEYTPAPDIIHESAGHAPIIAEKNYQDYLSYFGSIGAKAMFSSRDFELYEAIRALSILKEMPDADAAVLRKAERKVEFCQNNLGDSSEMALLSRLHWWTVEYGLIGDLENPKIYGAGLLSSIGESATCMQQSVKKIIYTIDAVNYAYDITKPQPQLFVTPTFSNLINVLEQFADTMAFRMGGSEGILKAIECKNTSTAVYSSGLQVSGTFTDLGIDLQNNLYFIKTTGPTSLAFGNKQLDGHGKHYHQDGFSSPVGKLKNSDKALENFSELELEQAGIGIGKLVQLDFENGIVVKGELVSYLKENNHLLLLSFTNCQVNDSRGNIYYKPEWGTYDLAVGEKIVSVFCGSADKDAFEEVILKSDSATHHPSYNDMTKQYHQLFKTVRDCREQKIDFERLLTVWKTMKTRFRDDWLCCLEILEILEQQNLFQETSKEIKIHLEMKASQEAELFNLIDHGLLLVNKRLKSLNN
jgi:phenylalanine-4-hydroxylase